MKKAIQLFLILTVIMSFAFVEPTNSVPKQINIVIDAGHGGVDAGATIKGISEKQLVEQLSKKIKSSNQNVLIHFTRNEDKTLTLQERTEFINALKPDLVLSIHINVNKDSNKSGLELYTDQENDFSEK
jgi:N-acetylmuramoyl-L-alanine amidase